MSIQAGALSRPPIRLNTFERVEQDNDLRRVYEGKNGVPIFHLVPKERALGLQGSAIKSVYSKQPASSKKIAALWIGKMGVAKSLERSATDSCSWKSGNEGDMNEEAVKEKIGCDAYRLFGDGLFGTPKTRLSSQPILDPYTQDEPAIRVYTGQEQLVVFSKEEGAKVISIPKPLTHSLRVMSKWIHGYVDFTKIQVPHPENPAEFLSFMQYIEQYRAPSECVIDPVSKAPIPIYGVMAVLAAASSLGDIDVFGATGANCGVIFLRSSEGIVHEAFVVKIDPGFVFSYQAASAVSKKDPKDIQYSTHGNIIHWSKLSSDQKDEFLEVKRHIFALNTQEIVEYLFERKGTIWKEGISRPPHFGRIVADQRAKLQKFLTAEMQLYRKGLEEYELRREETIKQKGDQAYDRGNYDRAFNYCEKMVELQMSKENVDQKKLAYSYQRLGQVYRGQGQYILAVKVEKKALQIYIDIFGERHLNVTASYNNIGVSLGELGRYEEALRCHMRALELKKELLGKRHPDMGVNYNNIGVTLGKLGRHEEALKYQMQALECKKELLGERHLDIAGLYNNIGEILRVLERCEEALKYQMQALELRKELLGERHPDVAESYRSMGCTLRELGRHEEALRYLTQTLDLQKELLGAKHPEVALSYVIGLSE